MKTQQQRKLQEIRIGTKALIRMRTASTVRRYDYLRALAIKLLA